MTERAIVTNTENPVSVAMEVSDPRGSQRFISRLQDGLRVMAAGSLLAFIPGLVVSADLLVLTGTHIRDQTFVSASLGGGVTLALAAGLMFGAYAFFKGPARGLS